MSPAADQAFSIQVTCTNIYIVFVLELSCAFCADMNIKATSFCMGCDYPEPMCTLCADVHVFGRNNSKKHFIWSDIQMFHAW